MDKWHDLSDKISVPHAPWPRQYIAEILAPAVFWANLM
jgi:hypothetical protein